MSDTTITPRKRKELREYALDCKGEMNRNYFICHLEPDTVLNLLDTIEQAESRIDGGCIEELKRATELAEQAEARAEKAESDKAALEEDLEATEKNLKEFSGFIEELLSGLKHRFPVQYAAIEGDEYGDDAFSSHDLFELVIDPAVNAAQEAEAENARLTKMVDWLAGRELTVDGFAAPCQCESDYFQGKKAPCGEMPDEFCPKFKHRGNGACWVEAARRAVAESEVKG